MSRPSPGAREQPSGALINPLCRAVPSPRKGEGWGHWVIINTAFSAAGRQAQRANLAHLHFHHRWPRHRQRFGHHRLEILSPIHAPRLQTHRLRQQGKVWRVQLVVILTAAKILILNTAHYAVAAVIHNQQRHVGLLLRQGRQFAKVEAQAAVAHQADHFTLRIGNRGAHRHR